MIRIGDTFFNLDKVEYLEFAEGDGDMFFWSIVNTSGKRYDMAIPLDQHKGVIEMLGYGEFDDDDILDNEESQWIGFGKS